MYKYVLLALLFGIGANMAAAAPLTYSVDLERSSNQNLSISDGSQTGLDISGDLTIEAWIKLESHPGTDDAYTIAGKHGVDAQDQSGYMVVYEKSAGNVNRLRFDVYDNAESGTQCLVPYTLSTNQWYHIALVYDASAGGCEFFVDGVSVGTDDGLATSIYNNTAPFRIGTIFSTLYLFDGQIDDVRVWSKTRTIYDIQNTMFGNVDVDDPTLQGYWKLSDLYDASGNNNTLTNNGSAEFSGEPAHKSQCMVWGVF